MNNLREDEKRNQTCGNSQSYMKKTAGVVIVTKYLWPIENLKYYSPAVEYPIKVHLMSYSTQTAKFTSSKYEFHQMVRS